MAVKYHCQKCERRFVDWGAKKLEFTCPDCNEPLVVLGGSTGKTKSKPSLRRPVPVSAAAPGRVSGFDMDDEEVKIPLEAGDELDTDAPADFVDDDDADIDLSADDDEPVAADDADD